MTKITTYNRGIIIDGHADTKEECETITLLCNSLAKDKNFKQVAYDKGYAAFERVGHTEELRFWSGENIYVNGNAVNIRVGGENTFAYCASVNSTVYTVTDTNVVWNDDTILQHNSVDVLPTDTIIFTTDAYTTRAATVKKSVDLTTLSGWANLAPGNHTIKIVAKGTGYRDSEKSAGVEVTKAASIPALADATWEQINQVSQAGTASNYWAVGDEKTFTLSTGEAVTVQILGFNHDDLADESGKAGITFGMKNLLTTKYPMNNRETNSGGWTSSVMRTSTMATLLTELPDDLQSVIKQIYKKTTFGRAYTTIVKSTDSLFLFSEVELDGTTSDGYAGEGSQYEYWQNHNVQSNRIKKFSNGVAGYWWLRSPKVDNNSAFRNVRTTGIIESSLPTLSYGVCFGFCV